MDHFVAGAVGGTVACMVTCPLEVLKTRLQACGASELVGTSRHVHRMFLEVIQREGVGALWKGASTIVFGVGPTRAVYFGALGATKSAWSHTSHLDGVALAAVSAGSAGLTTAVVTSPLWVVKTHIQLETDVVKSPVATRRTESFVAMIRRHAIVRTVNRVWATEGARGFYKGLTASMIGVSEGTMQFVMYSELKRRSLERQQRLSRGLVSPQDMGSFELFGYGAVSKFIAAIVTYPHEVVRTRLRQQDMWKPRYKGFIHTIKTIAVEEGRAGLYGGLGVHLLRVVPNAAILYLCVEIVVGKGTM